MIKLFCKMSLINFVKWSIIRCLIIPGKPTDWQLSNGQFLGTDGYFPTKQFRHRAFLRPDSFSPEHFPDLTFPQAITIKPIYLTFWMKKVPYQYLLQAQLIPPIKEFGFQPLWTANWKQVTKCFTQVRANFCHY